MTRIIFQRQTLLLSGVLVLGIFFRIWEIGKIPQGFYSDEALYGYEAYSLLLTGKDQFGNKLPSSIAGFGDYRPALYIYFTVPFIKFFGLNEFATRLPSAIASCLTLLFLYLFTRKYFHTKIALYSVFILVISPWSIFFGRMAHETNLMTLLIISGYYLLINFNPSIGSTFLSIILLVASMYTYHTARLFVPLSLLITCFFSYTLIVKRKKIFIPALLFFTLLLLPLLNEFKNETGWTRVSNVSIWSDPGLGLKINMLRGYIQTYGVNNLISRLFFNKGTVLPVVLLTNIFTHFSARYLITTGDPNDIYNVPYTGILLWIEPFLILTGIYSLFMNRRRISIWILILLLLCLLPDSLTRIAPSSARTQLAGPLVSLLGGVGCYLLLKNFRKLVYLLILLVILNSLWFWHNYILLNPVLHERAWQIGTKEMINKSQQYSLKYQKIWISRTGWGWIHLVFHTKYSPVQLQQKIKVSPKNEYGFWWVYDVGKYHLDLFPKTFASNTLYVGKPNEFPEGTIPFDKVSNELHQDIYWFVDGKILEHI